MVRVNCRRVQEDTERTIKTFHTSIGVGCRTHSAGGGRLLWGSPMSSVRERWTTNNLHKMLQFCNIRIFIPMATTVNWLSGHHINYTQQSINKFANLRIQKLLWLVVNMSISMEGAVNNVEIVQSQCCVLHEYIISKCAENDLHFE